MNDETFSNSSASEPTGGSLEQTAQTNPKPSQSSPTPPVGLLEKTNGFQRAMLISHAGTCMVCEIAMTHIEEKNLEAALKTLENLVEAHMKGFAQLCRHQGVAPVAAFDYYTNLVSSNANSDSSQHR